MQTDNLNIEENPTVGCVFNSMILKAYSGSAAKCALFEFSISLRQLFDKEERQNVHFAAMKNLVRTRWIQ